MIRYFSIANLSILSSIAFAQTNAIDILENLESSDEVFLEVEKEKNIFTDEGFIPRSEFYSGNNKKTTIKIKLNVPKTTPEIVGLEAKCEWFYIDPFGEYTIPVGKVDVKYSTPVRRNEYMKVKSDKPACVVGVECDFVLGLKGLPTRREFKKDLREDIISQQGFRPGDCVTGISGNLVKP